MSCARQRGELSAHAVGDGPGGGGDGLSGLAGLQFLVIEVHYGVCGLPVAEEGGVNWHVDLGRTGRHDVPLERSTAGGGVEVDVLGGIVEDDAGFPRSQLHLVVELLHELAEKHYVTLGNNLLGRASVEVLGERRVSSPWR